MFIPQQLTFSSFASLLKFPQSPKTAPPTEYQVQTHEPVAEILPPFTSTKLSLPCTPNPCHYSFIGSLILPTPTIFRITQSWLLLPQTTNYMRYRVSQLGAKTKPVWTHAHRPIIYNRQSLWSLQSGPEWYLSISHQLSKFLKITSALYPQSWAHIPTNSKWLINIYWFVNWLIVSQNNKDKNWFSMYH